MSDDDLWRRPQKEQPADETTPAEPGDEGGDEGGAPSPVTDETQPISGVGPVPPAPPDPSYDSPSGPSAVSPSPSPSGPASGPQRTSGWNPYVDPRDPYGTPAPPPPTAPYPEAGYPHRYTPPQNPYVPPNEYAAPQSPYGSPYQPAYAGGLMPTHPSATTSMVLAIVGLVSIVVCAGTLLILSPVAWVLGAKAVREIDASPGRYSGRDRAAAGKIMGIIGTVLLALGIVAIVGLIALAVSTGSSDPTPVTPNASIQNG